MFFDYKWGVVEQTFTGCFVGAGLCSARLKITKNQSIKQKAISYGMAPLCKGGWIGAAKTEGLLSLGTVYKNLENKSYRFLDLYLSDCKQGNPSVSLSAATSLYTREGRLQ